MNTIAEEVDSVLYDKNMELINYAQDTYKLTEDQVKVLERFAIDIYEWKIASESIRDLKEIYKEKYGK